LRLKQDLMAGDGRNVEAVRRLYEAGRDYVKGEREPFEAAVRELCAPDILVVPSSALASGSSGPFRGREGFLRQQQAVARRWPEFEIIADDFVDVPPSTVVVLGKVAARRGDGSGYAAEIGVVNRLEDGQIVSIHSYDSKSRALDEAGAADLDPGLGSDQEP
jgi:ketosteroid isomerase-like protein